MKRLCILVLHFLWVPQATAQVGVVDSLQTELQLHPEADSNRANIFNALSSQYQWLDFNRSLHYAEEAQQISESISFQKGIATACFMQAHCYWALGDSERSIEKALRAKGIAEKEGLTNVLAETYRMMANTYRDQQEMGKAVAYIRHAERLALQKKNWDLLARVYNLAGVIDYSRKLPDSALVYYYKSLRVSEEHTISRFHIPQVLSNMGEIYLPENPDKGLEYFTRALDSAKATRNRSAEAGITADIGRAYILKENYKEANRQLQQSLKLSRELGLKRVSRYVYYALADLRLKEGKTTEAFTYMRAYYDVRDSLLNGSKTRQIVELETRFEKEKQEQKIQLLEQEHQLQRLWTNVLIVGSILLTIALITIYRLQKLRSSKAKQLLETQKVLNEKLKETDLMKSRFFANISHEFRTPLALILGPVEEQLKKPNLLSAEKKFLMRTERNARRLLDLVNQLLDLSRLEARKMELVIRPGKPDAFLNLLVASFDSLAEHKHITFIKNISTVEKPIGFDRDKVEKIATNILFNAFKFTPPGGQVIFSMYVAKEDHEIVISVADTGKGIPAEEQANVFSPFYQLKYEGDDGPTGTGLGLSLVNELVKLYGGRIELTSESNNGTCITVTLPIYEGQADVGESSLLLERDVLNTSMDLPVDEEQSAANVSDQRETILIVEDNAELSNYLVSGFKNRFNILAAKDGDEGYAIATEEIPDVIISDVMMPKMNGLELTSHIKRDVRTSHIPVLLLTAKADGRSRIEGLKQGADDYLAKPFSMEELQIKIDNLMEQRKRLAAKLRIELTQQHQLLEEPKELSLDEKFLMRVTAIIQENMSNSHFSVELLAEEMNLSRAQLFRKLKALISLSPSEFINDIRLQRAAQLILAKADNVAQIGYAVGFSEQSYFAKRFRKKYGVSPTEYAQGNSFNKITA